MFQLNYLILIFPLICCAQTQLPPLFNDLLHNLGMENLDILNQGTNFDYDIRQACESINQLTQNNLCYTQLKIICEDRWLIEKMFDASSKFPYTGMLVSTKLDLGNYDECIEIEQIKNNTRLIGKHCTSGLIIPTTELTDPDFFVKAYKLSICLPDGCTAQQISNLLNSNSNISLINDVSCSTKDTWKIVEPTEYLVIVLITCYFCLIVTATIMDLYYHYTAGHDYFVTPQGHKALLAFSFYSNGKKLFSTSSLDYRNDQIKVIHGLKSISMIWVIVGHCFVMFHSIPLLNSKRPLDFEVSWASIYISTAHLAVDTFIFLSGVLLAYHYMKKRPSSVWMQIKSIPMLYLNRYLRLTPAAVALLLAVTTVLTHLANGPLYYESIDFFTGPCKRYWWSFLLYIQNYVNYNEFCILHTWYLSVDWQLFLLSPLVLIPLSTMVKSHFKFSIVNLVLLNVLLTFLPFGLKLAFSDFDNIYDTHSRLSTYFIGLTMGVFLREKGNEKFYFSKKTNITIWILILALMVCTLSVYKALQLAAYNQNDQSYNCYYILLRTIWAICLGWIIYSCHSGHGGVINKLLTFPFFEFLSKLSYCMYLTHSIPLAVFGLTQRTYVRFTQFDAIYTSASCFCFTLLISVFWSLAFESPIIVLQKYLFKSTRT